jgi:outer membrane biosynthesis protein TonB
MTENTHSPTPTGALPDDLPALSWSQTWPIFQSILEGVSELHTRELIHGGLTLASFEFDESGKVSSACIERLKAQAAQQVLPQPTAYRAPELAHGQPLTDPRIDVYSMGILLYRLLCGRLPWEPETEPLVLQHRKEGSKLPNPKRFQQEIPTEVLKVLRAATSGAPKVRPKSAIVLRAVLGPSGYSSSTTTQSPALRVEAEEQETEDQETEDQKTEEQGTQADQVAPLAENVEGSPPDSPVPDSAAEAAPPAAPLGDLETTVMEAADRPPPQSKPTDIGSAETTILSGTPRDASPDDLAGTSSTVASSEVSKLGPTSPLESSPQLEVAVTTMHPSAVRAQQSSSKIRIPEPTPDPGSPKKRKRKREKKSEVGSSSLWLGLALGFSVLVIGGLVFGLVLVRNMAQGPEAGQLDELLRSSGVRPATVEKQDPDTTESEQQNLEEETTFDDAEDALVADSLNEEESSPEQTQEVSTTAPTSSQTEASPSSSTKSKIKPKVTNSERKSKSKKKTPTTRQQKSSEPQSGQAATKEDKAKDAPQLVLQKQALADTVSTGRRVSFTVAIPSPPKGIRLSVALRMQCASDGARWRRYTMRRAGRTIWEKRISFKSEDRGTCKYYFTAQGEEGSAPSSLGSRAAPFDVNVR